MGADVEYSNPIVPGFAPDPSVVYVDGTFFLATSSFHVFPGLPIYASKDLKTWAHIGNALNRRSQLSLEGASTIHVPLDTGYTMVASMGIVAPSIHHHNGTFYMVSTNTEFESPSATSKGGYKMRNFIIGTDNIWSGQWSDPVYFDFNGIDTSLFFDDDDRVYVHGSWMLHDIGDADSPRPQPTCTIKQAEIDVKTGKLLSEYKEIWPGWAKYDTEGPHMYRVGGWYYLIAAEGGTFEHHLLSVGRAKSVWGPFETWEKNPIMTADGTSEYIQNVGHGGLFQDGDGRWWAAVLGVRKQDDGTLGLGRESFLSPVDWPDGGWPTVRQPKMQFTRESVPSLAAAGASQGKIPAPEFVDDLYIRDHDASKYTYSPDGQTLVLVPSRADMASPRDTATFLGRRQRFLTGEATARLNLESGESKLAAGTNVKAGLALYYDPVRFASVAYDVATTTLVFDVHNASTGLEGSVRRGLPGGGGDKVTAKGVEFRVSSTPARYGFEAKVEIAEPNKAAAEAGWVELGSLPRKAMDSRDFTGPVLGVFAHAADEEAEAAQVVFEGFALAATGEGAE